MNHHWKVHNHVKAMAGSKTPFWCDNSMILAKVMVDEDVLKDAAESEDSDSDDDD